MTHQHEVVENFQLQITQLRTCLENKAPEIINILCELETPATANTEVHDTIKTLSELSNDFDPKHFQYLNLLVTYQPSNLPLYSLILYCIIPSFYFNRVAVYIPHKLRPIIKQLAYHLNLTELFEGVCVSDFSRRVFEDAFSSSANTIIFNGKYDNALFVIDKYPSNILFIYSGSGFNPIIIDEQSDTDQALDKLMASRLFNSGQDCGAPDIIFVHDSVYDTLVTKLKNALTEFCINFRRNGGVSLYPIIRESTFTESVDFIKQNNKCIIFNGGIDNQRKIILPHIIEIDTIELVREHFAPIFCLHRFQSIEDLLDLLDSDERINQHSMYLTYFGKRRNILSASAVVLYNHTVLDIEDGNKPFGGFGTRANFVRYDMNTKSYPIHIPSVIDEYITKNSFSVASSDLGKTNPS